MQHEDALTLPEPAREMWRTTRDTIRRALAQLDPLREWRLGGGTILAARWGHRLSFDIDIQIDEEAPLGELEKEGFGWLQREAARLGAKPIYLPRLNLYALRFGEGPDQREVQVWSHKLPLDQGHRTQKVEGSNETVLSTAQILRGKLARATSKLGRDVYDIDTATEADPKSLEIAVNTLTRDRVSTLALDWVVGYGRIGNDAHAQVHGATGLGVRECYELGRKGAKSLLQARYASLRLGVENDRIVIEAVTEGNNLRRMTMSVTDAEEQFAALGMHAHLQRKGPGPRAVLDYAIQVCRTKVGDVLIFEEKNDEPTRWRTAERSEKLPLLTRERPGPIKANVGGWERNRTRWWGR